MAEWLLYYAMGMTYFAFVGWVAALYWWKNAGTLQRTLEVSIPVANPVSPHQFDRYDGGEDE